MTKSSPGTQQSKRAKAQGDFELRMLDYQIRECRGGRELARLEQKAMQAVPKSGGRSKQVKWRL